MAEWNASWSLLALLGVAALAAVVFGLPPQSVGATEPDGERIAKGMLDYEENVDTLSGTVNVTYEDGEGIQYYRLEVTDRPGDPNHRAEIVESSFRGVNETVFVSNGSVAWSYDVETGEVTRRELTDGFVYPHVDVPHDESTLEALDVEYVRTETVAGREAHLVRLSPPADAGPDASIELKVGSEEYQLAAVGEPFVLETQYFWVDAEYGFPLKERSEFRGPNDETVVAEHVYESVTFNEPLGDDPFQFDPPADATVTTITHEKTVFDSVEAAERATQLPLPTESIDVPEGYELAEVTVTERTQTGAEITYRSGDDELRVLVRNEPYDLELGIHTQVGGQNATVVQGYPDPFVRWNCGDTGYAVGGSADQEVWLAVAESIGCGGS